MLNETLTELERSVIEMLLDGDDLFLQILRDQLRTTKVASREFSGTGFFTTFKISEYVNRIPGDKTFKIGDVEAEMEGLNHGAGFLLYVEKGALHMLEGYSYDEEWPRNTGAFKVHYIGGNQRDFTSLRENFHKL